MDCDIADKIKLQIKFNDKPHYVYLLCRPNGEPFYVGVGSGKRIFNHERVAPSRRQEAKYDIINEIIEVGEVVKYSIVGFFDDWYEAAVEERRLIAFYGRVDIGTGILANRTNGGQGIAGIKWHLSEARKDGQRRAVEKRRGWRHSEESKAKIGAAHKGRKCSADNIEKTNSANRGKKRSDEQRARMSEAAKGRKPSPEKTNGLIEWYRANADKVSEERKERWKDPEYREKMSIALKSAKRDFSFRRDPVYREAIAQRMREKWKDPEFRERVIKSTRDTKSARAATLRS